MTELILASSSPSRLFELTRAGITPRVIASHVDEDALVRGAGVSSAADVVALLARAKAEAVAAPLGVVPETLLLGCDSVLELDGRVWGKPHTPERAREQWHAMSGRSATLHSGHWLIDLSTGSAVGRSSRTIIHTAAIEEAELDAYIATGEPLQVAGALTIDGFGGAYVTGIEGDHHGVIGVSLPLCRELVGELGYAWHDLWDINQ